MGMTTVSEFSRPLVMSGPSGTGKSTLLKRLFEEFPDKFGFSVSHTTRAPRSGEEDGKAYHFVTKEKFEDLIGEKAFLETAKFSSNYYGTSVQAVKDVSQQGRRCILDIELQGVKQIKASHSELGAVYVFVSPPSWSTLASRLTGRGTETDASVKARLEAAYHEIQYAKEKNHDYVIVNDDLDRAYAVFKQLALGEEGVKSDELPPLDDHADYIQIQK
ncbi:guanylate kinase [Dacryopinax primogenitus]|uniref:Guanylate kinase n=1 Tax=Dacryopinax primogenitus (strain DJM 731) TaxID=1858805 RepID=M5G0L1_DACPD|nr:guanylate kinase [Dacryopinax primogenitus]EJU03786.1 guanylate kinase [Dacryopinax primogenitus]